MLALLAAAVLVGQTMFTSIVSAVEAEGLSDPDNWEVIEKLDVEDESENDVAKVELANRVDGLTEEVREIQNGFGEYVKDLDGDWTIAEGWETSNDNCGVWLSKFVDAINNYLDEVWADGIEARLDVDANEVVIEYENELEDLLPYIEALIQYILWNTNQEWWVINNIGELFNLDVSWVTSLISLRLKVTDEKGDGNGSVTMGKIKGENGGILEGCSYEDVTVSIIRKVEQKWEDFLWCKEVNVDSDTLVEIVDNFKWLNKWFTARSDATSVYVNNSDLYFNISAVTSLIDYLLVENQWTPYMPKSTNDTWGYVWASIHNAWYELTIDDVTTIIDLILEGNSVGYVVIPMTSRGWLCFNLVLGNAWDWSDVDWDGRVCTKADLQKEDLEKIANNFVNKWFTVSSDELNVYVKSDELKSKFNIDVVTSLIDYLLVENQWTPYTPKSTNDTWGNVWASIHNAWYELTIQDVTIIIDMLLVGDYSTDEIVIPLVVRNSWCFNLVIGWKWNWGNGDNNNSYSWGGSSSGGGSSSRNNSANDDELEFRWEVVEPQVADSCSIEWSTLSDEENQAYLWACENWMILADNVMKANFASPLTRAELDKMMSVYAKQLLGRSYVINENVSYPDVDNSLWDLPYYIQEWYKLQIMWIHANGSALTKFMPKLLVTRWEFATVFSRVLYGNLYNIDGANYYEKHLQVLKDAGILTNTNPSLVEARGWVVLMLYRSQKVEKSNWKISNEEVAEITWE